jgi:hypothetical protein
VLDDREVSAAVRAACARGLGRIPDLVALDAITSRISAANEDAQVRRSLLSALGQLGSAWAWEARGRDATELGARMRQGCFDALTASLRAYPEDSETIKAALDMVAWPGTPGLPGRK